MKKAIVGIIMAIFAFACLATTTLNQNNAGPENEKDPVMSIPEGDLPVA